MRSSRSALLFLSNLSLSKLSTSRFSALILCILISSILSFAAAPDRITGLIASGQLIKLSAGVPLKAQPQYDQGPVDPSFKLSYMTLQTVPSTSQQRVLSKLLADQQDPHSPQYHKWLTPEQYADRFALSANDIQKVTAWLQSQGFAVLKVARSRNLIVFSGTAAQVETTFQIKIHNFDVSGEKHFSNTTPPSIPSALAGIVAGVGGLNDFRPKPHFKRRNPAYSFPVGSNQYKPHLAPGDIATVYDINPLYTAGTDGTGQKLVVVGQTDVYLADLNDFRSGFGLSTISNSDCATNSNDVIIPPCNDPLFQYVLNSAADPGVNPQGDDLPQADIDLEWSGATARGAQIIFVNSGGTANGVWDAWHTAITENLAPVITMSYGICELGEAGFFSADEGYLQEASAQGITFMNSSGGSGAAGCDADPPGTTSTFTPLPPYLAAEYGLAVNYPASSPEVTGVGGTMIPISELVDPGTYWSGSNGSNGGSAVCPNPSGPCIPENGWNDNQEFGYYCAANPGDTADCDPTVYSGQIPITSPETFQIDWWIGSSTGGPSNCYTTNDGVCTAGFPQPTWQAGLSLSELGQTTAVRFTPDVSLLASVYFPGYIMCTAQSELGGTSTASSCANGISNSISQWDSIYGGTSFASPIFAGIVTLLNQYLVGNATPGLGNINAQLYSLAKNAPTAFHQVTGGDNYAAGSNIVYYCAPGAPSNQPEALQCPAGGTMGYLAANADTATGYNLVTGLGSVDAYNLAVAWATSRGASTITVQAAPAQIILSQTVTLTATMSPLSATGVVGFQYDVGDTATSIGQATLSNGVATLSTNILPIGIDNIVAFYSGDGNNLSSNSSATPVAVTVLAPDFTLTPTSSTGPVLAGQSAIYNFTIAPLVTSTFTSTVVFSCNGLPDATTTCHVSPGQIAAGTAGSPPVPVTLTVTTSGPNTSGGSNLRRLGEKRPPLLPLALPLAGIVMVGLMGRRVSKHAAIAGLCVLLALLGILLACGTTGKGPLPVTVTVNQGLPSSLFPNDTADGWPAQTAQFTATVTNGKSQAVNWLVTTANGGSIDANGVYTAPTVAAGLPMSVTITATSQSNPNQSGSAQEALNAATIPGTYPNIMLIANEGGAAGTTHSESVTLTVK